MEASCVQGLDGAEDRLGYFPTMVDCRACIAAGQAAGPVHPVFEGKVMVS
jgi:hypothetical protein